MKLTELQKRRRLKARLSFQKRCGHHSVEKQPYGKEKLIVPVCQTCGKVWEAEQLQPVLEVGGKIYCPDCKQEITGNMIPNELGWCSDCYHQWKE